MISRLAHATLAAALALATLCASAALPAPGEPGAPADPRYCGDPARTASGAIRRSRAVLRHFVAVHPCPSTDKPDTACPNWSIDHVIPLASGGCDEIGNLQWLPDALKSCAVICKDRFERAINAVPPRPFEIRPRAAADLTPTPATPPKDAP
ncbi:HNH endonuclease [Hydrogenophaga taeniospiralis]|uniref:HNH endonuclease signature motif containing protein n=1 Tax=Hydrogenophaga taeniospiralis TaxID=65656 RepID=UPI001CFA0BCB|nr:HNH endonuclease signature motif containing protein [Hydrogenophaga taeniospiralis]MCB4365393.1 HNH endonuclease [Hydrogenophaga taeniospiralis]